MINKYKLLSPIVIIFFVITFIMSLILKSNLIIIMLMIILGLMISIVFFTNEKFFLFSLFLIFILYLPLSKINSIFNYFPQYLILIMLFKLIIRTVFYRKKLEYQKGVMIIIILMLVFNIIGLIINYKSINIVPVLYSILRRYSFIIIYLYFYNIREIYLTKYYNKIMSFLYWYCILQIPFIVIQYIRGVDRDNITGFFGNNSTGILLQLLIIIYIVLLMRNDRSKNKKELIFFIFILIYSALAEVKIGFVILPIIYLIYIILNKKSFKIILQIVLVCITLYFCYGLFIKLYPKHDFINDVDMRNNYLTESYYGEAINRFGYMNKLKETILTDYYKELLGVGIGAANPSELNILEGDIYNRFKELKYHSFFIPYSIIENGIIGTTLYIFVYFYIILDSLRRWNKKNNYNVISNILICILTVSLFIYNNSINSPIIVLFTWISITINNKLLINKEQ